MASVDVDFRQNVVSRVVSLPLVSSTYGMVSSAYSHTKENHPYLRSLCEVAEKGVLTVTAVAMTSAKPIIQKMEPQILVANNYACIGLDKIEEKLPILHQPSDKIVSRASDLVVGAKDALKITVTGAKDTVAHTITEVVGKTQEAVHESMERTKAVVNGSINTVLRSHVLQIVHNGVDHALAKSETLVDQYLPLTEEELAEAVDTTNGLQDDTPKPNCYIRLGCLSTKVSKRAYQQAITRVRNAKSKSREAASQLHHSIYLDVESRTLSIACSLSKQLQTTCVTLLSGVQCLPLNFQDQAYHVSTIAGDLYQKFNLVSSFREASSLLATTKEKLDKMTILLDDMMDYVINNTPLNWLVPDFTISDLSSESDMQDIFDLDEYYMQDYMHTNGHINPLPRAD